MIRNEKVREMVEKFWDDGGYHYDEQTPDKEDIIDLITRIEEVLTADTEDDGITKQDAAVIKAQIDQWMLSAASNDAGLNDTEAREREIFDAGFKRGAAERGITEQECVAREREAWEAGVKLGQSTAIRAAYVISNLDECYAKYRKSKEVK